MSFPAVRLGNEPVPCSWSMERHQEIRGIPASAWLPLEHPGEAGGGSVPFPAPRAAQGAEFKSTSLQTGFAAVVRVRRSHHHPGTTGRSVTLVTMSWRLKGTSV